MNDPDLIRMVAANRVIAVVRADSAESGLRAAEAALMGGVKLIEVALSMPGAYRIISELRRRHGDRACVGAGSVMGYEQVDRAIKSGAQFAATPHTSAALIEFCRRNRMPLIVGALTPSEVATAWAFGVPMVTLFPVSSVGGPDYISKLTSRMTDVRLAAAGGVGPENIVEYFAAGAFAISVGSRLFTRGDLQNENYAAIAERARGMIRLAGIA
ncbi:MAG TPA: bifunctional 4-hydroxy-2-oxoglutarate aldolase/2-dehydro-3-deoxy-phosphogluconate aldolase [Blastocatellia bacterium]|nr:bifunctional 4-hydroxy-2-oxoglutarate aldolase/2-dehydro-3-deoxy-phosphogluconate aldolase [Blastocatellia bacterium]